MVTGFFKKLTNKLFNSSSKFTKDLDEAVNEVSETEVKMDGKKIAHDNKLENNEWICGDYSLADIANWPWVRIYFWAGINITKLDNLTRWMKQMEERPACKAGILVPKRENSKKVVKNVKNILQT